MKSKRELFPLTTRLLGKPPSREDLFWTRSHLILMTESLEKCINPYVYMQLQSEGTKLRVIVSDLNRKALSLWPVRLTTGLRLSHARSVLKELRSTLHSILKDYPK